MGDIKERPIIFSGEMVRVILDGRKTQTRRVMKPQPPEWCTEKFGYTMFTPEGHISGRGWYEGQRAEKFFKCPYGKVGDRLWVREAWHGVHEDNQFQIYNYRADCPDSENYKWKPSIHMPRWASRILLEVTGVRAERVQDISESDAKAEGFDHELHNPYPTCATHMPPEWYELPPSPKGECSGPRWDKEWYPSSERMKRWNTRNNFIRTWELLNKERGFGWDTNCWVWVVEFKRVDP